MNTNKISNKNPTCHSLTSGVASTCHSLSSDSEEIRNLNQMPYLAHAQGITGESGRSMVEMLGVLAVIGVLSVGGIAGYKVAMTKHQANELLNEASKRAVVVAAKIAAGQFDASTALNEFGTETIAGASFTAVSASGNTFTLTLSGVSAEVCAQIKNIVGENGNVIINDGCTTFTYNADLSNGVSTGPETITEDSEAESCTYGEEWGGGEGTGESVSGYPCQCPNATPIWTGSDCVAIETTQECFSFEGNECGPGYYCRFKDASPSCYANGNKPLDDEGGSPVTGICTKVTGAKKSKSGKFYVSSEELDWFSAQSWCQSFGKDLVSYATISDSSTYGCDTDEWSCNFDYFRTTEGLRKYYWTKHLTEYTPSCDAWNVYVSYDSFSSSSRSGNDYLFALCE